MQAQGRHADYDPFAWFYDRHWGGFSRQVLPVLERLVLGELPAGARILDLCCGTGHLAALLTERGFRVVGVDVSAGMLAFARVNAPQADFVLADARDFALPEAVDAAVSLYDSLNHILALDELARVFVNVRRALVPGGAGPSDALGPGADVLGRHGPHDEAAVADAGADGRGRVAPTNRVPTTAM